MNRSESKYFHTAVKMNEALVAILAEKPFEYITIKEICEKAGVNRSTFYLHYENIGDLLAETTRHLLDEFLAYFPADDGSITNQFRDRQLGQLNFINEQYLRPYLTYIRDNRRVFATALEHSSPFGFEQIYQRMFQHIFDPILERFRYPVQDRKYVMMFYLNGIHAVVAQWLKEDCARPIEDISQIIRTCVFGLDGGLEDRNLM